MRFGVRCYQHFNAVNRRIEKAACVPIACIGGDRCWHPLCCTAETLHHGQQLLPVVWLLGHVRGYDDLSLRVLCNLCFVSLHKSFLSAFFYPSRISIDEVILPVW